MNLLPESINQQQVNEFIHRKTHFDEVSAKSDRAKWEFF